MKYKTTAIVELDEMGQTCFQTNVREMGFAHFMESNGKSSIKSLSHATEYATVTIGDPKMSGNFVRERQRILYIYM